MATIKTNYGAPNQTITITLASLVFASAQSSAAIDNTTNLYVDALVQVTVKTGASGIKASDVVNVFAYGSSDGGTTYPDGTGTNTNFTLHTPPNVVMIGQLNCVANGTVYSSVPFSVAAAFGGVLPAFWGIVVENQTNNSLAATGNNATFQGILASIA